MSQDTAQLIGSNTQEDDIDISSYATHSPAQSLSDGPCTSELAFEGGQADEEMEQAAADPSRRHVAETNANASNPPSNSLNAQKTSQVGVSAKKTRGRAGQVAQSKEGLIMQKLNAHSQKFERGARRGQNVVASGQLDDVGAGEDQDLALDIVNTGNKDHSLRLRQDQDDQVAE